MPQTYYPDDPILEELLQGPSFALPGQTGGTETPMPTSYPSPQASPVAGNVDPYGLSSYYEGAPSYINLSQVPQPQTRPELEGMIGGQGFSPEILAQMRAGAIEDTSNAALPQMGQLRRGLSAAGLTNSPAAASYQANLARQTGDKQSAALREIGIGNAVVGNENKKFGLNLAHQYAVENANRLFEAMGQNLSQSGANTRAAVGTAFNENPFQPSEGRPQQSRFGSAVEGAASNIDFGSVFGGKKNPLGTAPPYEEQGPSPLGGMSGGVLHEQDPAFSKNPFKGY